MYMQLVQLIIRFKVGVDGALDRYFLISELHVAAIVADGLHSCSNLQVREWEAEKLWIY
jgi:hypothetical protein